MILVFYTAFISRLCTFSVLNLGTPMSIKSGSRLQALQCFESRLQFPFKTLGVSITYFSFNILLIWLLQYINNNSNFFKFLNEPQIIYYMVVFYENHRESPILVVLCPGQQHIEVRDLPPLTKIDPAANYRTRASVCFI